MPKLALTSLMVVGVMSLSVFAHAKDQTVKASQFLGPDWMHGPYHTVEPLAQLDGQLLTYRIQTPNQLHVVHGTVAARERIREITATETLRTRSTPVTVVESAAGRVLNVVGTPIRVLDNLGTKAKDISSVEEGILFLPKEVVNTSGQLLNGVGELAVTGVRITTGAASTKCSGFNCVEKAGEDIWSGFNSLMGKHNSARRLHSEFGTDPQTANKDYRKQIDRLSYAESYSATAVKIGGANAGVEYLSPGLRYVGWYNNGEFIAGYEDAHRQRNFEKETYRAWGVYPDVVEGLYKNKAFTKLQRRRLFKALDTFNNTEMQERFLMQTAEVSDRESARILLAEAEDLDAQMSRGDISEFYPASQTITYADNSGAKTTLVYYDFLDWSDHARMKILQDRQQGVSVIRVLGRVSPRFISESQALGLRVLQVPQ